MTRAKPMLATACAAAACLAMPSLAAAADHDPSLTIYATPHTVIAGSSVVIHGKLFGRHAADRTIVLWHRTAGHQGYTVVSRTTTNSQGQYAFTRAEGIVNTNRSWYVRGPGGSRSRVVSEQVAAEVSLTPSATVADTRQPITFTGTVTPGHAGSHVQLQEQKGQGNSWRTVATGVVGAGSTYSINYQWRILGPEVVRVLFTGDHRNVAAASESATIVINQSQKPNITINTSNPIATAGTQSTISGTVLEPGTSTPAASTQIALYSRPGVGGHFSLVQTGTTGTDGSYAFTVQNTTNTLYQVRMVTTKHAKTSAVLFQAVSDTVTLNASAAVSTVGGTVTLSGTISPDKSGSVAYLQILGADGHWHPIQAIPVAAGSAFSIPVQFGDAGTKEYRVAFARGTLNVGGISAPVTITVSLPATSSLPTS